jgi:hypothetical protein
MARMRLRRSASTLAWCLLALAVVWPVSAAAQTCPNISLSIPAATVPRFTGATDSAANAYPFRAQNLQPTWINYKDCASDIRLQFTLEASGLPCSDQIQAWVGPMTDCTQTAARQTTSGSARCWPVSQPVPPQQTFTIDIRAEDLVAHITDEEPPVSYVPTESTAACQSQAAPGGTALSLYFMAIEANGQAVDGTSAEYDFGADLVGPYPPTNVVAGIGENLIVVNWTPQVDSTIQGFNIYCQNQGASGGDTGAVDAPQEATLVCPDSGMTTTTTDGAILDATVINSSDAGCHYVNFLDAGGSGGSSCVSNALVNVFSTSPSTTSTVDGAVVTPIVTDSSTEASTFTGDVGISEISGIYLCGQVGGNTTSSYVVQNFSDGGPNIVDFTQYAVTVASFDGTGNVGIIGNLSCVIPEPVTDFWTAYTSAGGLAGGGFCALQGPGMPVSGSLLGMGLGASALGYARRRRRRR